MPFIWPIGPAPRPEGHEQEWPPNGGREAVRHTEGQSGGVGSDVNRDRSEGTPTFPTYKPDVDIFWVQSGWYQVKRRHATLADALSPLSSPSESSRLMDRVSNNTTSIPFELHDIILDCINLNGSDQVVLPYFLQNNAVMNKHEMGLCALVCSAWARALQEKIFNTITLRSRNDLYGLLSFLESPHSRLSQCVQYVRISPQRAAESPWLHLLSSLYPRLECKQFDIALELDGPLHSAYRTMRSVHYQLPRENPAFSAHVVTLRLSHVHFQSFGDLMQLVGGIPMLSTLTCDTVTWGKQPGGMMCRRVAVNRARRLQVEMTSCTHVWAGVLLFLGLRRHRRDIPSEDLECLGDLMSAVEDVIARPDVTLGTIVVSDANALHSGGQIGIYYSYASQISAPGPPVVQPEARILWKAFPTADDGITGRIARIHLELWDRAHSDIPMRWQMMDWTSIDNIIHRLRSLEEVTFVFRNETEASDFVDTIVSQHPAMNDLFEARELMCLDRRSMIKAL